MYKYTDKVIRYLTKQIIRTFGNAKVSLLSFDELNVLDYSAELYKRLEQISFEAFWLIAKKVYKDNLVEGKSGKITRKWLEAFLLEYNPVTKYVYQHEVDRKRARFEEAVIATAHNKAAEVDAGMRLWSRMANQYAIDVTDAAAMKAYVDSGVERVMWVTEPDERRCKECAKREGQIYDIARVPPKPHINCRCRVVPYLFDE